MAGYWKNGTFYNLGDASAKQSFATGLCISGNDVYISGWYCKTTWDEPTPIYWKNGVAVDLPAKGATGDGYANAYGITVSGNDVYVCGAYRIAKDRYAACYWKNKVLNTFSDNTYESAARAIPVANGVVHLAGTSTPSLFPFPVRKPAVWNGGKLNMLDIGTYHSGVAYVITVSGNDIYVAGTATGTSDLALYWKNGTMTAITNSEYGMAIALDGPDVFIGGALRTNVNVGENFATYWKNGLQLFSHNSGTDRSRIFDILVIK
ncbi:hypothetical protein [Mucilaginibacter myungsuensis]|uniref:Uncharacterized protein n=1 Tax=Mucilaginibacter myungsuensis TaxID=649104 RepID=A0A929PYD0_9SPHI|nr:hypothetical protein [Mucilaginibacter myungsuensis]MBE9663320.1 hypothetical protein [Mucilaginibacter myungsuensis]MDN3600055.1 hypothetical protein [Mucilaginibacter myungsuensis]